MHIDEVSGSRMAVVGLPIKPSTNGPTDRQPTLFPPGRWVYGCVDLQEIGPVGTSLPSRGSWLCSGRGGVEVYA